MRLGALLVADPVESVATHVASQCERLAEKRVVATTGQKALEHIRAHKPEMCIVSLELQGPTALDVVKEIRSSNPKAYVLISFREMSVPSVEKLGKMGVAEILPNPLDITSVFRSASLRFNEGFRRHDRHNVALDVVRADGVLIGRTRNVSEGGLLMDTFHPVDAGDSLLVNLGLPNEPLRTRLVVLGVEGSAPTPVQVRGQFVNLRGPDYVRLTQYLEELDRNGHA